MQIQKVNAKLHYYTMHNHNTNAILMFANYLGLFSLLLQSKLNLATIKNTM
jgi:hypothetical protein